MSSTEPAEVAGEDPAVQARADAIYGVAHQRIFQQTDRLFAGIMVFQWILGIVAALVVSPRTWVGSIGTTHVHVWAAVLLGGLITWVPVAFALLRPGRTLTRHVIAVGQTLTSALLIHLTGGRIETHFHVFGSLAFLAFYRDWRVLVTATVVVSADHLLRGVYWPQSVYGILTGGEWRWLEHSLWVLFEDYFLAWSCIRQVQEMRLDALRTAELERSNRAEEELNRRLEKEVALRGRINQELAEFNYAASHDLQEPLRTMASYCTLLRRDVGEGLSSRAQEDLDFIEDAARRMRTLVQDILVLSRAGRAELRSEPVDLEPCVAQVVGDLQASIAEAGAQVEWGELPTVMGDAASLRRVLQNLINNAIKFNRGGPPRVKISAHRDGELWEISVADNGIGIEPEFLAQVFLPFTRLHSSSQFSGSGVGLSICRKLVERQGGRIDVRSTPGEGSVFSFFLPAAERTGFVAPAGEPASQVRAREQKEAVT